MLLMMLLMLLLVALSGLLLVLCVVRAFLLSLSFSREEAVFVLIEHWYRYCCPLAFLA